jgi:hypothetical protein
MLILLGAWAAVAGGIAALAGLAGMRRVRRLRRGGVAAWALLVPAPVPERDAGDSPGMLLQYALADGRLVERPAGRAAAGRKPAPAGPGRTVLIWYDPADPDDVLVYGRWGRAADRVFLASGLLFILIGTALAVAAP